MVEQVVTKPGKADVEIGNGKKVFEICRWYNGSLDCCGLLVVFVAAASPKHVARCCNMSQYFNRCGESIHGFVSGKRGKSGLESGKLKDADLDFKVCRMVPGQW